MYPLSALFGAFWHRMHPIEFVSAGSYPLPDLSRYPSTSLCKVVLADSGVMFFAARVVAVSGLGGGGGSAAAGEGWKEDAKLIFDCFKTLPESSPRGLRFGIVIEDGLSEC
ncbi:MAG: hypothetical protein IAI48_16270 [Candidatus Eremiobacteraeota bacterium]|nr:hypothetical protein [Candidatus Eremiobacteraeota bacterium]